MLRTFLILILQAGCLPWLSAQPGLRAEQRGAPYLNLRDGRTIATTYVGDASAVRQLRANRAEPTALASADFDEDGVPDLISGYATPDNTGIVTIHRGNVDAIWPYGQALLHGEP